ncbi:MAG: DUF3999 family protein [Candidatus Acidiferrales bacterium]
MKRLGAVASLALIALAALAQSPDLWRGWRYSAPIAAGGAAETRLVRAQVPLEAAAHGQPGWSDLRVVDEAGREVPYVLHAQMEKRSVQRREARLLEVSFAPGESTQGIVDLGSEPPEHNSIELEVNQPDYFLWVEVAVGHNGRNWRILNERSPIYRFTSNGLAGNQTVHYSTSRSRYLRVRLLDGEKKLPLRAVRVTQEVREEAEMVPLPATFRPDPAAPRQQTWRTADLRGPDQSGRGAQPVSEVRFEHDAPDFYRTLRISRSDDGKFWSQAASGDIYRVKRSARAGADNQGARATRERLCVTLPETYGRYWRVELMDRNDPPLQALRITLHTVPRHALFRAEPGRSYRLLYGNERAPAPQYSLGQLIDPAEIASAARITVGAATAVDAPADPLPWTERHPYVLWAAAIFAAAVLGLLALRALRG